MLVASSTLGWKHTSRSSLSSASRRSAPSARRRGVAGSCTGSYISQPLRWRRAVSAAMWARCMSDWRVDRLLGVDGDADVDAQRQQHALGLERRIEARDQQAGRAHHLFGVGHVGQDHGELLAAQASQGRRLGQQAPHAAAGLDEQAVGAAGGRRRRPPG